MLKIVCWLIFWQFYFILLSKGQDKISENFRPFFESLKQGSRNDFYKYFISTGEYREIYKAGIIGLLDGDSLKLVQFHYDEKYKAFLKDSVLDLISMQAESMGINLNDSKFIDVEYTISKRTSNLFVALTGDIIFLSGSKCFKLPVMEAILINNAWKISKLGRLQHHENYLPENGFKKISEYGTLNFDYSLVEVKLELLDGEKEPPPPPPPLSPVQKRDKKKVKKKDSYNK